MLVFIQLCCNNTLYKYCIIKSKSKIFRFLENMCKYVCVITQAESHNLFGAMQKIFIHRLNGLLVIIISLVFIGNKQVSIV